MRDGNYGDLEAVAREVRKHIIRMTHAAGSGHPGGSLSAVEILTALFFRVMKVNPEDPCWPQRDRFVLSKGHACPALYAVLAKKGFFPEEDLLTLRRLGSHLQGHPDMRKTPGVEASTGSLGQGLSFSVGLALAGKMDGASWRVYTLVGDGESEEGQIWEAAMAAAHYRLDNLTVFLDWNGLQIDGPVADIMCPLPLEDKWRGFGWEVLTIDGHNYSGILDALAQARHPCGRPAMILARTVKGKGVSFMENQVDWHGKAPSDNEAALALQELGGGMRGD
ncbi:MAG: transketolase [Bacillota bacterium]